IPTFYEGNYNVTYELIQPLTQAIEIWNQAQAWFIQSYYPQNYPKDVFTLELASSGQTAQVTVQYVYTLPNGYWAETSQYGTKISMVISRAFQNSVLAAHELGHVLGLADNSIKGDLERSSGVYQPYPSTLDLYGVFLHATRFGRFASANTVLHMESESSGCTRISRHAACVSCGHLSRSIPKRETPSPCPDL